MGFKVRVADVFPAIQDHFHRKNHRDGSVGKFLPSVVVIYVISFLMYVRDGVFSLFILLFSLCMFRDNLSLLLNHHFRVNIKY